MKRHLVLIIILIILGLFIAFSAASHPYDAPLTFIEHKTDDGRPIFTNIPKACFSKGVLTCDQLHPIFGMPVSTKRSELRTVQKPGATQAKTQSEDSSVSLFVDLVKKTKNGICHPPDGTYYDQITDEVATYSSMDQCKKSGGREPKNKSS